MHAARRGAVVIGVGNPYRHDDGVGLAVLNALAARRPAQARADLVECDGEPSRMIDAWAGAELAIVVDAVRAADPQPGRVHRATLAGHPPGPASASSHGLGVLEAAELARVLDRLPDRLVCYGVEAVDLTLGPGLSPAVRASVAPLADQIASDLGWDHP